VHHLAHAAAQRLRIRTLGEHADAARERLELAGTGVVALLGEHQAAQARR
jgi:hypothetical protein